MKVNVLTQLSKVETVGHPITLNSNDLPLPFRAKEKKKVNLESTKINSS